MRPLNLRQRTGNVESLGSCTRVSLNFLARIVLRRGSMTRENCRSCSSDWCHFNKVGLVSPSLVLFVAPIGRFPRAPWLPGKGLLHYISR